MHKVLVIGSGGREHAVAWKLAQSLKVKTVFVAPGNDGMLNTKKVRLVPIGVTENQRLVTFAKKEQVTLTIVGPEIALANGVVDCFEENGLLVFGPNKYLTQLESSKFFAKKLMNKWKIPTANYITFTNVQEALQHVKAAQLPLVIKKDGLAGGKGVVVATTRLEATKTISEFMNENLNVKKKRVVIEQYLEGQEFSQLAFVHKTKVLFTPVVCDYKQVQDYGKGPNTGGMGAATSTPWIKTENVKEGRNIIRKMVVNLQQAATPYSGILYAGLIQTLSGVKVIEFNVRWGDPETEVIMLAMQTDLFETIHTLLTKVKGIQQLKWYNRVFIGVTLAATGYPVKKIQPFYVTLPLLKNNSKIFAMSLAKKQHTWFGTSGRVLFVANKAKKIKDARALVYEDIQIILKANKNLFCRTDVGLNPFLKPE